jgi:hypothetical protein
MKVAGLRSACVLMLAVGACARPPTPPVSLPKVAVYATELARYVEIRGPSVQHAPLFLSVPNTNFFALRSWLDRENGRTVTQLYVSDSYEGPQRRWDAAYDIVGTALPFTAIRQDEIGCKRGCSWVEDFAAEIPEHQLAAAANGFVVTFAARSGKRMTITVTPQQIHSQLAAIAVVRRILRAAVT